MKSGFSDPISVKSEKPPESPKDGKNSPWDFRCPQYDQRSSCFVNAGTHYGLGHKTPVGHAGNPKSSAPTLPKGRVKTMETYEKG